MDWNDGSTANPRTDTFVTADINVTANFNPSTCYTLVLTHAGAGTDPIATPTNSTGCMTGSYHVGELITLNVSDPLADWQIIGWTGTDDDGSTLVTNQIIMPAEKHTARINYSQTFDPCGTTWLVNEINNANSNPDELTINLEANCSYVLVDPAQSDPSGFWLPMITTDIILLGNGSTISPSAENPIRFLVV